MHTCKLEAHRGVGTEAPENTLAAFRLAKEQGYDLIELDPKFTKDNHCVLLHDRTLNRTCRNEDGSPLTEEVRIADITLDTARTYDAGIACGVQYKGERIPTLEEVLAFSLEAGIPLKFDNVLFSFSKEQQEFFFATVERMHAEEHVGYTMPDLVNAEKILARFPNAVIHFECQGDLAPLRSLAETCPQEQLYAWVKFENDRTSWCHAQSATPEYCSEVRKYAKLGLWLLDKDAEYRYARDVLAADMIETDGKIKPSVKN